jgi:hypothetical protein
MLLALPAPEAGPSHPKAGLSVPVAGPYRAGYGPQEGISGDGSEAGLETVRRVLALHEVRTTPPEIEPVSRNRMCLVCPGRWNRPGIPCTRKIEAQLPTGVYLAYPLSAGRANIRSSKP